MAALLSFKKIHIKSNICSYEVNFDKSISKYINSIIGDDDILIIDSKVFNLYSSLFNTINNKLIIIESSEKAKSYLEIETIIHQIVEFGFRKNNRLIAVGGGIIQDITSFISSILYRGVDWIFLPTNLLSQCDSCIGSKLSVNLGKYKNLIGGFYPPKNVYIDVNFLKTLETEDILSGLGEILHYCLVSSYSDALLFGNIAPLVKTNITHVESLIGRSLEIKKAMIEIDEYDKGPRNIFNYGHTFGHALESVTEYSIPHGICVALGIDLANLVSYDLNLITKDQRNFMRNLCSIVYSEVELPKINYTAYKNAIHKDKKNVGDKIGLILLNGIGKAFKRLTPYSVIEKRVENFFSKKQYMIDL